MTEVSYKRLNVYKPYGDELPWQLITDIATGAGLGGAESDRLIDTCEQQSLTRIGKIGEETVAIYCIAPGDTTQFRLVILGVASGYRRKGLGSWMLGHALGLAEAKGRRSLQLPCLKAESFFTRIGFQSESGQLSYEFMPE